MGRRDLQVEIVARRLHELVYRSTVPVTVIYSVAYSMAGNASLWLLTTRLDQRYATTLRRPKRARSLLSRRGDAKTPNGRVRSPWHFLKADCKDGRWLRSVRGTDYLRRWPR